MKSFALPKSVLWFIAAVFSLFLFGQTHAVSKDRSINEEDGEYLFKIKRYDHHLKKIDRLCIEANTAIVEKDWSQASALLKEALEHDQTSPEAHLGFAKFHTARGEHAYAETALIKGLELNPEDARLLYRYSKILAIKGDLPLSTEKAEQAAHHRNSHWFYTAWLSDLNLLEGDKEEAQKNLRVAIRELRADIQQLVFSIVEYEKNLEISGVYTETGSKQRTGENFVVREISEYFEAPEVLERSLAGLKKELAGLEEKLEKIQA